MRDSSRSQVSNVLAAVSGVIAYQWVRNDTLAYERALVWGGWLVWSVALYVAWGVVERHLRKSPPRVADKLHDQLGILMRRSPGFWQWIRVGAVAYGAGVVNALVVNEIQFSAAVPWLIGAIVAAIVVFASEIWSSKTARPGPEPRSTS